MRATVVSNSLQHPWTVAHQASLPRGFFRQENGIGLPCPPPGHLPHPGTEPISLMSPASVGGFFITSATWEALPGKVPKIKIIKENKAF